MRLGIWVYGMASAAAGILDLIWGNFEPAHQPTQAFGDHIPAQQVFAYFIAIALIFGGAAIVYRRTARGGAITLSGVYFIFAVFWLPRFYTAPLVLGFRPFVYLGVLGGVAGQLIVVAAGAIVYALAATQGRIALERLTVITRWTFGLSSVDFGVVHLMDVPTTARMIGKWMPLGADFWTVLSGIAFVLAGISILSGVMDVLAARLLALMLLFFEALVLVPLPFASPHDHVAWGGSAYNLAAAGAVWIFAESIASWRAEHGRQLAMGLIWSHN